MLLYAPPTHRRLLRMLLALAAELAAGIVRGLDHDVAHVRLAWWREESGRLARGTSSHPWLRAAPAQAAALSVALAPLVDAAALDLASARLTGSAGERLTQELFLQAAAALSAAPLAATDRSALAELGRCVAELEQRAAARARSEPVAAPASAPVPATALTWLQARQRTGPLLAPALQPALAALLVWTAIAARQARCHERRKARRSATMARTTLDGFADNLIAWRCARAAAQGRCRIRAA
jgi:hypothetical protein